MESVRAQEIRKEKKEKEKERKREHVIAGMLALLVVSADRSDSEALRPGGEALVIIFIHHYNRIVGSM